HRAVIALALLGGLGVSLVWVLTHIEQDPETSDHLWQAVGNIINIIAAAVLMIAGFSVVAIVVGILAKGAAVIARHRVRTALVVGMLGFAWFVWPTPYRIVTTGRAAFQVNRFTGARCAVGESCWRPPAASSAERAPRYAGPEREPQRRQTPVRP